MRMPWVAWLRVIFMSEKSEKVPKSRAAGAPAGSARDSLNARTTAVSQKPNQAICALHPSRQPCLRATGPII